MPGVSVGSEPLWLSGLGAEEKGGGGVLHQGQGSIMS